MTIATCVTCKQVLTRGRCTNRRCPGYAAWEFLCDFCGSGYSEEEQQECATCEEQMCERCLETHKCRGSGYD